MNERDGNKTKRETKKEKENVNKENIEKLQKEERFIK